MWLWRLISVSENRIVAACFALVALVLVLAIWEVIVDHGY